MRNTLFLRKYYYRSEYQAIFPTTNLVINWHTINQAIVPVCMTFLEKSLLFSEKTFGESHIHFLPDEMGTVVCLDYHWQPSYKHPVNVSWTEPGNAVDSFNKRQHEEG